MSKRKYLEDKPLNHTTMGIPKEMSNAVEESLKADYARRMGYLYKVDLMYFSSNALVVAVRFLQEGWWGEFVRS